MEVGEVTPSPDDHPLVNSGIKHVQEWGKITNNLLLLNSQQELILGGSTTQRLLRQLASLILYPFDWDCLHCRKLDSKPLQVKNRDKIHEAHPVASHSLSGGNGRLGSNLN